MYEHLDPVFVQAVAFYHVTPDDSRQVLYRAREPETMDQFSYEAPDVLRRRIELGRRQLGRVRNQRPAPELIRLERPGWRATTIRWLIAAGDHGIDLPVAPRGQPPLATHLESLLAADRSVPVWLEDEAALLAATVAMARAAGSAEWADRGRAAADRVLDQYGSEDGWRDRPEAPDERRSRAVTDDILPAVVATVTEALLDLGQLVADPRYQDAARRTVAPHLPTASPCGPRSAGLWRAWFRAHQETGG